MLPGKTCFDANGCLADTTTGLLPAVELAEAMGRDAVQLEI